MKQVDKDNAQRIFKENICRSQTGEYYRPSEISEMLESAIKYADTRKKASKGNHEHPEVINLPCAFDIETTNTYIGSSKFAFMYEWTLGINGLAMIGRTWDEFNYVLGEIRKRLGLNDKKVMEIYIHNMGFDFQFMRGMILVTDYFAREMRKPMYIQTDGFIFRDSLCLTGYSLETTAKNLVEFPDIKKLVGNLDYQKIRHSGTPLTTKEIEYCIADVLVIMCDIFTRMKDEGWNIVKIPMTKTGYVRRVCREACLYGKFPGDKMPSVDERNSVYSKHRELMCKLKLTEEEFDLAKKAFAGGFTHANAMNCDETLTDIASYDFTSSYPAVMVAFRFPMSKGVRVYPKTKAEFEAFLDKRACLFEISLRNVHSKVNFESYLSVSKCISIKNPTVNNGRVWDADELRIVLCDVDWWALTRCYDFDGFYIHKMYVYERAYLPTNLVKVILLFYEQKTKLKGVEGKEKEYMYFKELLNSVYGMCVTDIESDEIVYENKEGDPWSHSKANRKDVIKKYNDDKRRFLSYLWGVWVTAYARRNLWSAILNIGDDYCYSDTDSVKIKNHEEHQAYFEKYNNWIIERLEKACEYHGIDKKSIRPSTIKGKEKPLGVWDFEGVYDMFKTLGAKRYIYTENEDLHITVAGVNKKKGAKYLMKRYKTFEEVFDNFSDNLHFPAEYYEDDEDCGSGKLTHSYVDTPITAEVTDYLGNTATVSEKGFCHLEPADYSLSMASEFAAFILNMKETKGGI